MIQREKLIPPAMRGLQSTKLLPKYLGEYTVTRVAGPNSYEIDLPPNIKVHKVINADRLIPFNECPEEFKTRSDAPPPPIIIDDELEYEVEEIIRHRKNRGKDQYLVKWVGFPIEDATWEPPGNLKNAQEFLDEFKQKQKQAKAPPRRSKRNKSK
jgi:Chromo (CHRromatin Organisation MOdifier) domain